MGTLLCKLCCRGQTISQHPRRGEVEQLAEIREIADAIAEKVVEVHSLDDLAGIWATLIPRRNVA
jgi:hypothetical protein